MLNMNRVTLLGRAGRDPELRTMRSGDRAASFSLATTERWKRQDGQTEESTEWHRIVVYGAAVEAVETMVRKGCAVLIEGRLAVRAWKDGEGRDRQVTEIVVAGRQGLVNVLSGRPQADTQAGTDTEAAPAAGGPPATADAAPAGGPA